MRTKVVKAFFDKNTDIAYKKGEFFDGDESRVEELAAGGFVGHKKASTSNKTAPSKSDK